MLNLLDIALPGEDYHPRRPRIIINEPDTVQNVLRPEVDTTTQTNGIIDTLTAPLDSLGCKEAVADTLRSAINFINGIGSDGGNTSVMWTLIVALAALSFCFYFIHVYRRSLPHKG